MAYVKLERDDRLWMTPATSKNRGNLGTKVRACHSWYLGSPAADAAAIRPRQPELHIGYHQLSVWRSIDSAENDGFPSMSARASNARAAGFGRRAVAPQVLSGRRPLGARRPGHQRKGRLLCAVSPRSRGGVHGGDTGPDRQSTPSPESDLHRRPHPQRASRRSAARAELWSIVARDVGARARGQPGHWSYFDRSRFTSVLFPAVSSESDDVEPRSSSSSSSSDLSLSSAAQCADRLLMVPPTSRVHRASFFISPVAAPGVVQVRAPSCRRPRACPPAHTRLCPRRRSRRRCANGGVDDRD